MMSVSIALALLCVAVTCTTATRPCPPPTTNDNVGVTCYTAGISRTCTNATSVADTRALFSCNRHYIPAGGQKEKFCMDTGNWSDWSTDSLSCRLGCGRNQVSLEEFTRSENVQQSYVPWHAGIYMKNSGKSTYRCGGTLIETDVVITAASCVSVLGKAEPEPINQFTIRFGIYDKEDATSRTAVHRKVKRIAIHDNYMGNPDSPYADNIALLFLGAPVPLRSYVYPVCSLHKSDTRTDDHLETGKEGFVPVWSNSTFDTFSYLPLTYVPAKECAPNFDGLDSNLLFESNFCASTTDSGALCEDATGAGMVFLQHEKHQEPTWHLEGIVNSPRSSLESTCFDKDALFLRLKDYKMWILQTIATAKDTVNTDVGNCTFPASNPNVDATCFDAHGLSFSCPASVAPGTVVKYKCQQFYIAVSGAQEKICLPGGAWSNADDKTITCELDCGRSSVPMIPAVVYGLPAQGNQWPWHAGLFRGFEDRRTNEVQWINICGGTLINEDTILTAAHCVTESEITAKVVAAKELMVGLGKQFNYLDSNETFEQTFRVRGIVIHERYKSLDLTSLDDDIALIFLERHAVYSVAVLPICSHHNYLYDSESNLQNGNLGWVAGWGITEEGSASTTLKMTALPFVSTKTCEDRLPEENKKLVPETQYCAGFYNDTNVCKGDSGGGMVFLDEKTGKWHLEGIVSHSLFKKGNCFTQVSFFVKVAKYKLWMVKQIDVEKRRNRGFGWCPPLVPKKGHHVECWRAGPGDPEFKESTCYEWQPPVARLYTQCTTNYYDVNESPLGSPDYICVDGKWSVIKERFFYQSTFYKYITCIPDCGKPAHDLQQSADNIWPWHVYVYSCIGAVEYCKFLTTGSIISNRVVLSSFIFAHIYREDFRVVVGTRPFMQKIHLNDTFAIKVSDVRYLDSPSESLVACALVLQQDIVFDDRVSPVCWKYSQNGEPLYRKGGWVAANLGSNSTLSLVPITVSEKDQPCSTETWTIPKAYSAVVHQQANDSAEECRINHSSGSYVNVTDDPEDANSTHTWILVGLADFDVYQKKPAFNCSNAAEVSFLKSYLFQKDIVDVVEDVHGVEIEYYVQCCKQQSFTFI